MRTMRTFTNGPNPSRAAGRDERPTVLCVRLSVLVIALAPWALPASSLAAEPAAAAATTPDAELLEFLGSGDDGDPELQKYLVKENDERPQNAKPAPKGGDGKT